MRTGLLTVAAVIGVAVLVIAVTAAVFWLWLNAPAS